MTTPAHVVGTVADQRPEPPAVFPDRYTIVSWIWLKLTQSPRWVPYVHGDYSKLEVERAAQERIADGHRNVRIIRIPGDAPAQGERHE